MSTDTDHSKLARKVFVKKVIYLFFLIISVLLVFYFKSSNEAEVFALVPLMVLFFILATRCSNCTQLRYQIIHKKCNFCDYPRSKKDKVKPIKIKKYHFIMWTLILVLFLSITLEGVFQFDS